MQYPMKPGDRESVIGGLADVPGDPDTMFDVLAAVLNGDDPFVRVDKEWLNGQVYAAVPCVLRTETGLRAVFITGVVEANQDLTDPACTFRAFLTRFGPALGKGGLSLPEIHGEVDADGAATITRTR